MPIPSRESRPGLDAFTLIELLVVVAIIAILAAMLLPALQRARGMGKQATCVSNLRQLMLMVHQYAEDQNDYFPATAMVAYPGTASYTVAADYPAGWDPRPWFSRVWPYLKSVNVFYCPNGDRDTLGNPYRGHYGANMPGVFNYSTEFGWLPLKRSSISNPTGRYAIMDSGLYWLQQSEALSANVSGWVSYVPGAPWYSGFNNYDDGQNDWPKQRHPSGVNVAFVDGHVESLTIRKFVDNTAAW